MQEANVDAVTDALCYDSLPGVPRRTIASGELEDGLWHLSRTS